MKPEELEYEDTEYTEKCGNCGMKHTIFTQKDECLEYYTDVHVVCVCVAM